MILSHFIDLNLSDQPIPYHIVFMRYWLHRCWWRIVGCLCWWPISVWFCHQHHCSRIFWWKSRSMSDRGLFCPSPGAVNNMPNILKCLGCFFSQCKKCMQVSLWYWQTSSESDVLFGIFVFLCFIRKTICKLFLSYKNKATSSFWIVPDLQSNLSLNTTKIEL